MDTPQRLALIRSVSSFFGLSSSSNDDARSISARSVDVEQELPTTIAGIDIEVDESRLLAESKVEAQCLRAMLADADAALAESAAEMERMEQDWTEKVSAFMQKNGQLRVDLKAAQRERATAEGDLDVARKRMAELEQALTDVALGGGDGEEDLPSRPAASSTASVATVESLGDGHGGIDLGSGFSSPDAKPHGMVLDADTILPDVSAPNGATQVGTKAATLEMNWTSPPKLSLNEGSSSHDSLGGGTRTGKGCCAIL